MNSKNHPIVGNSIQKLYFKHSDHDYCIMRKESFGRSSYLFVWFSSSHPPMVLFSTCQPPPAPWVNFQSIRRGWHFVQPKAAKWPECWEKTCHSLTYKHIPICNVHMHIYIYAIAIQTGSFAIWNRPFPNRSCAGSIFFPDAMPRWRMSDSEDVSDEAMGGLEDDESSSEESLSNFFCEDWVPKQKLPCLFCFKNNVNFPLVSHNRPTMPSQELSAEQQSFLEFGQDFSLMGGRLEIKIGQPCEHLVVVCVCCWQHMFAT